MNKFEIKDIWTDNDFELMGWHDSTLYQIKFLDKNLDFTLYIDYIFEWIQIENKFEFLVAPCELVFRNVLNLKVSLEFENYVGIYIDSIKRKKIGKTPNGKFIYWKYSILTDRGGIEFTATGFEMHLISKPILSKSQDLSDHR